MNEQSKAKLDRFLNDQVMSKAVYDVLHSSFLKGKGQRDIQILAAERLAVDLLDEGWKELGKFKQKEINNEDKPQNVGL